MNVAAQNFSKLPIRQVTSDMTFGSSPHISKLPIRQVTSDDGSRELEFLSKLPIRQVTGSFRGLDGL